MERVEIASLYKATPADGTKVTVCGWAKTVRDSKKIGFISLADGSCYKPVQIVFQADKLENYAEVAKSGLYTSFEVTGTLVLTPNAKQPFEINADTVTVLGTCGSDYPLQKNKMGMDYLRTLTHLRPRTNTFNAAFRVRGQAAYALHEFFHKNGFTYVHTPIFTGSDCEGAGEMFQVTTLDLNDVPKTEDGKVDYSKDFFKRPVNLTVSGQLEAEAMAMALGKVYTFGPTFRAEKSYDTRHAAEFWMIEPEMAFADLNTYMDTAEAMTKYVIRYLLDNCPDELAFFNQFFDKGLIERLELVANSDFARVSYTDAIELLKKNDDNFQYKVSWGIDLQTEHERYLTEQIFKRPVFVTDYPKEITSARCSRASGTGPRRTPAATRASCFCKFCNIINTKEDRSLWNSLFLSVLFSKRLTPTPASRSRSAAGYAICAPAKTSASSTCPTARFSRRCRSSTAPSLRISTRSPS